MNRTTLYSLLVATFATACNNTTGKKDRHTDSLAAREAYAESPVLKPEEALKTIQLHAEDANLQLSIAATEPLVFVPVAVTQDVRGRLWVVEMTGFMPDVDGKGEEAQNGKIVILEDTDHDGKMDKRTLFMDSLVLPRAVCLVGEGVLVAEPPYLWYVENNGDKAGKKTLVDDKYADGGNVEHQPNGLLRGVDNWIYNAKSNKRYRKVGDRWLIENTHFRGQWGITQDNKGRLYYNTNSDNLLGDYFPPSMSNGNPNQRNVAGFGEVIVRDTRVFPLRATPGVNRGYQKEVLDDSLRLRNFTAACGPVIVRGSKLGNWMQGKALVAEPAGNLVSMSTLSDSSFIVSGKRTQKDGVEFISSTDERFRPVNLYETFDGSVLVLDMYRGIIQHKTYLTDYLKKEIKDRDLTQPLNCGRIYRIEKKGTTAQAYTIPTFSKENIAELCQYFTRPEPWMQEHVQEYIVDHQVKEAVPILRAMLKSKDAIDMAAIRILYTLEGLQALTFTDIASASFYDYAYRMHVYPLLPKVINAGNAKDVVMMMKVDMQTVESAKAVSLEPVVAASLNVIKPYDKAFYESVLQAMSSYADQNIFVIDALISTQYKQEKAYQEKLLAWVPDTTRLVHKQLRKVLDDMSKQQNEAQLTALKAKFPRGYEVYNSYCKTCHGDDGGGVKSLAPPLNGSEWVTGDRGKLIKIVLFGLSGPVKVNGKTYQAPEINGDMPGIGNSDEFSDSDIASLLSFIRNSWNNKASEVSKKDIEEIRAAEKGRTKAYTIEQLH
ncbi:DUF7133 domain-containing protein [Chitinophaga skermanii]|nr:c-type cytochrome [Chitinophaga skermanii]